MGAIIGPVARPIIQPVVRYDSGVLPWEVQRDGGAPSISLLGQTFTRALEGSYLISAPTDGSTAFLAWALANVLRLENRGDGAGPLVLIEREATNFLKQSRDITNAAAWAHGLVGATVTADAGNGPDATAVADRVQAAGAQFCRGQTPVGPANPHVLSAWGRAFTGPTSIWVSNYVGVAAWTVAALPTTYARQAFLRAGAVTAPYYPVDSSLPAGSPQDMLVDLHQIENGRYPTSAIRTTLVTVTRPPDNLRLTTTPTWLLTQRARFAQVSPLFANTDLVSGDVRWLFTIGSASDGVRIRHNGVDVRVEAVAGGVVKASSGAITCAAHGLLGAVQWDPATGVVSVGGVAGATGTAWTWGTGTVRIGGIQGGTGSEADCRFSTRLEAV